VRSNGGIIGTKKTVSGNSASGIWAIRDAQREQGAGNWISYFIEMYLWGGGGGGGTYGSLGSAGGAASGSIALTIGTVYSVLVGNGGAHFPANTSGSTSTFGGGGAAAGIGFSGAGGGYTGIFLGASTFTHGAVLLMAGGGGGGGAGYNGDGGGGGGATGQNGYGPLSGGGGTQSAGGAGGNGVGPGSALQGGTSGSGGDSGGGGGGGGGYYGGGAGWNGDSPTGNSNGGGGSGYKHPSLIINGVLTQANGTTPGDSGNPYRSGRGAAGLTAAAGVGGCAVFIYDVRFTMTHTGLTGSTTTSGSNKITTLTAGSGNVSWA
jgi:hypothetical protein